VVCDEKHKSLDVVNQVDQSCTANMSQHEFDLWSSLLQKRTGMVLPVQRKSFLVTNLGLRMKELGCRTYQEYYDILSSGMDGELEWKFLIDRLTVHETRFFRHPASLKVVRDHVLERIRNRPETSVHLWSVACSTGEEAYSLAITVDQALQQAGRDAQENYFSVVATDISLPSIKTAREAKFKERQVLNHVSLEWLEKYFDRLEDGRFQVVEKLRRRVCFTPMNILAIVPEVVGEVDVIYCQNLLIYFDRAKRFEIVDEMARYLRPGGLLILGAGELLGWDHPEMKKLGFSDVLAYKRQVKRA